MKSEIEFADEKIQMNFKELKNSKTEEKKLYNWICRAFEDLEENAFCGTQVSKKLIPNVYLDKYNIDNLWKYDLPNAWRLIYTIKNGQVCVLSIILEWMSHKDYERKFKY